MAFPAQSSLPQRAQRVQALRQNTVVACVVQQRACDFLFERALFFADRFYRFFRFFFVLSGHERNHNLWAGARAFGDEFSPGLFLSLFSPVPAITASMSAPSTRARNSGKFAVGYRRR